MMRSRGRRGSKRSRNKTLALTPKLKEVRKEALKDSTLYFLIILESALDDMVRAERMISDVKKDLYMTYTFLTDLEGKIIIVSGTFNRIGD
jgi:hypothetical protein